ncbi:unnamed protein product [Callosobruchus maculatus]|uniref:Uncharacterized protein n=1 Tax=Callosobruchus maculatus TaxID=64391 RepID=A0A653CTR6_CALMS|nr:unnamed protein product [Callosobruchus maculatus]
MKRYRRRVLAFWFRVCVRVKKMGKHSKKHRRARKVKKLLSAMLRECEDSSSSSSSATESDSLSDQECMEVEDQQDTPTNQDELINDRVISKNSRRRPYELC